MTSPDWLQHQAEVRPDKLALCTPEGHWSFSELDKAVGRLAGILTDDGIGPGDRVAYHLAADHRQVMLVHALTRIGAVLVPLNTRLSPHELNVIVEDADPRLVVHEGQRGDWSIPCDDVTWDALDQHTPSRWLHDVAWDLDALHAIVYTSGTTGRPKGVELSLRNQWWSAIGFALNAGVLPDDRWLNVMPLFHVGGLTILFRSVVHGSTVYLLPRFEAQKAHALMTRESITLLSVVPTMMVRLMALPDTAPPSLRLVLLGGAPATRELVVQARERGYRAVRTYGLTETASQVVTQELNHPAEDLASGHPNLPTQIRIVDQGQLCARGTVGEIWIHGPTVARGYWRNPEATDAAFQEGWLRTGDIGWLDDRNFLTVTGRLKDLIVRGGENISPSEVEEHLVAVPWIRDAAVFGVSDPHWGQEVACAIVPTAERASLESLSRFLSNHLASYKIPSIYFLVDEIPRNAAGKVLRHKLEELASILPRWVDEP
jgi:O-succinylbenzoic acid--CoA ligase